MSKARMSLVVSAASAGARWAVARPRSTPRWCSTAAQYHQPLRWSTATSATTRDKHVVTADTNQDKKPDVWKFFKTVDVGGQKTEVMTCKQIDLNLDGKIDMVNYYDDTGSQIVLEEIDGDLDGKFDMTVYYNQGKRVRDEIDTNFDQRADVWKYYEDGKLVRIERDTNSDGKVDEWEYYEAGKLDRIGYDTTGSGRSTGGTARRSRRKRPPAATRRLQRPVAAPRRRPPAARRHLRPPRQRPRARRRRPRSRRPRRPRKPAPATKKQYESVREGRGRSGGATCARRAGRSGSGRAPCRSAAGGRSSSSGPRSSPSSARSSRAVRPMANMTVNMFVGMPSAR